MATTASAFFNLVYSGHELHLDKPHCLRDFQRACNELGGRLQPADVWFVNGDSTQTSDTSGDIKLEYILHVTSTSADLLDQLRQAFSGAEPAGLLGQISDFFGGTGLLIVVGVALDLVQRIESHLLMERYEGFMKGGGKIKGRR